MEKKSKIIISVSNDLATDQRIEKICNTLHENGYEITLIGRILPESLPIIRPYKVHRMRLIFRKKVWFFAELNIRLFFKIFFTKKDILLANDLDTLLPNYIISKIFKKKLVYDSHELFTEIPELIYRPKVQNIWLFIEKKIFPKLKNVITVSTPIGEYYKEKYGVPISIIRNVPNKFYANTTHNEFKEKTKKTLIYQGAINMKRGLELVIDTMIFLPDWKLQIIGDGDVKEKLITQANNLGLNNVQFINKIHPNKLIQYTKNADIGLSLEEPFGLNYKFGLANKIFDYINAEIPIIVSDELSEMKFIAENYNVGETLKERNPKNLALLIQKIYQTDKKNWKFEEAKNELNWENESKKLLEIYQNLK